MAFEQVVDLDCSVTTSIGGTDRKTGKKNPTSVEGYFLGSRKVDSAKSKSGFCYLHVFQTKDGNLGVWGKTNLDSQLRSVQPGTMTRVTFSGMVETKNNPMYKYKVEVDKNNNIDVSDLSAPSNEATGDDDTDHGFVESDFADEEGSALDEQLPAARATPPARPAAAPNAARQAKVQALLAGRGKAAS